MSVPKLLNLNAPAIRNQRTLVWLQKQKTTVSWSKWDGIVTSLSDYHTWTPLANIVGIVITSIDTDIDTFVKELHSISKDITMILLPQSILTQKSEEFWAGQFDNVLNLDQLLLSYPFIKEAWDGSQEDAIALFAILCRYHRVVDCHVSNARFAICSPTITFTHRERPNTVCMVTQFFHHPNKERQQEINECLIRNCACPHIDQIVLLNETDLSADWTRVHRDGPNMGKYVITGAEKIKQVIIGTRLTYADFLKYVKENVPLNVYAILCNADIYFEDSLLNLWKMNMEDKMLALLRWDVDEKGDAKIFGPRADSQDAWIVLSDSIKQRLWKDETFRFMLGQPGCDNAFAGHMLRQGFMLTNPALSFQTYHLHNTNIRNYDKKNFIRSDLYINIAPSYMIDTKQLTTPAAAPMCICNELVSFEVKSSSLSNEITYCTMLEKEGRYKWEPSVENHYFEPAIPVYSWNNACVSPNGLVYDLYHIYTGKHMDNPLFNYWKNSNIDIFTPLQQRDKMIAIPFMNTDIFSHPDTYILHYLSRCIRLLSLHPDASFWIPKSFHFYLSYFKWNREIAKGVLFDEHTACWAKEVVGFLPDPSSTELGAEDITCLRNILPSWEEHPIGKICAVIVDSTLTSEFINERLVSFLLQMDEEWTIRLISSEDYAAYDGLIGATLCIVLSGQKTQNKWAKLWTLPSKCCLIEFQQELQLDGECTHLAHVAGFHSWVILLSKGNKKDVQEQMMEQFEKWFKKNSFYLYA